MGLSKFKIGDKVAELQSEDSYTVTDLMLLNGSWYVILGEWERDYLSADGQPTPFSEQHFRLITPLEELL